MMLPILVGLLSSVYCSDKYGQGEYNNEERRISGGGNYGGFIGLTTYPAGPFLVKGKFERDRYGDFAPSWQGVQEQNPNYDDGSNIFNKETQIELKKDYSRHIKNDNGYDAKYISNVGYKDVQTFYSYLDVQVENGNKNEDYLEYLGYRGGKGFCRGDYNRDEYGQQKDSETNRGQGNYSYYDDDTKNRCDYLFGFTGPTANDEPENLVRPCALDDWQCIRKYFAANGNCKPAYGPIPDPLYIDINTMFFPVVNLTVALPNLVVRGFSGAKIREFYVNRKSGNLVFVLEVRNLNETSPRAYFRYRRTGKESIVLADFVTVETSVTFTAVIPKVPNLRLDLADIHPFAEDSYPPLVIGPGAFNSTDPDVITALAQFNENIQSAVREALVFQAQLFTSIYIQENICDFGLKIIMHLMRCIDNLGYG